MILILKSWFWFQNHAHLWLYLGSSYVFLLYLGSSYVFLLYLGSSYVFLLYLGSSYVFLLYLGSSYVFLLCWAAFLSISLLSLFLFLRPWLIHARMPDRSRAFVHGNYFLQSWSGPMTLVVRLLQGAAFLSILLLVLIVSLIGPYISS